MTPKSALLMVLFPAGRGEILYHLFSEPGREMYVRELAQVTSLALRTVQQELAKLTAAGLLTTRTNGYHRFYRANRRHPLFSEIQQLVRKAGKPELRKERRRPRHPRGRSRRVDRLQRRIRLHPSALPV